MLTPTVGPAFPFPNTELVVVERTVLVVGMSSLIVIMRVETAVIVLAAMAVMVVEEVVIECAVSSETTE